ncbi:hypothetical protein Ciccas_004468 [Cichlidogyrus casuarinus]|uniref:Uncharacterized protein n=1 Tax=Cichlidogyrus casuarinus TaxID=1844966 RepID=A0ABD2QCD1_9PLAT
MSEFLTPNSRSPWTKFRHSNIAIKTNTGEILTPERRPRSFFIPIDDESAKENEEPSQNNMLEVSLIPFAPKFHIDWTQEFDSSSFVIKVSFSVSGEITDFRIRWMHSEDKTDSTSVKIDPGSFRLLRLARNISRAFSKLYDSPFRFKLILKCAKLMLTIPVQNACDRPATPIRSQSETRLKKPLQKHLFSPVGRLRKQDNTRPSSGNLFFQNSEAYFDETSEQFLQNWFNSTLSDTLLVNTEELIQKVKLAVETSQFAAPATRIEREVDLGMIRFSELIDIISDKGAQRCIVDLFTMNFNSTWLVACLYGLSTTAEENKKIKLVQQVSAFIFPEILPSLAKHPNRSKLTSTLDMIRNRNYIGAFCLAPSDKP